VRTPREGWPHAPPGMVTLWSDAAGGAECRRRAWLRLRRCRPILLLSCGLQSAPPSGEDCRCHGRRRHRPSGCLRLWARPRSYAASPAPPPASPRLPQPRRRTAPLASDYSWSCLCTLTTATVSACAWAAPASSTFVTVSFDGESARDWSCLRTFTSREVRGGGVRVGPRTAPPSSPRRRLGLPLVRSDVCSAAAAGRPHQLELFSFTFGRVLVWYVYQATV
jgi:hypothetical protein